MGGNSHQPKLLALSGVLRGRLFEFRGDELSIGRTEAATILIDDKSVSRHHCVFRRQAGAVHVDDMGSRNGTLVNGKAVDKRILSHGDRIAVGNSEFILLLQDENLSSLLSDVQLTEDTFEPLLSVELPGSETLYVNPEKVLQEVDPRILQSFQILVHLGAKLKSDCPFIWFSHHD